MAPGDGRARSRTSGHWSRAGARFVRDPIALAALLFLALVSLLGVFHEQLQPYDPSSQLVGPPFSGPSADHWFGTDHLGRDVLSRLLEGANVSMKFSLLVVAVALLVAVPLGLLTGYVGGRTDSWVMRVMDALMSLPALVLAIAMVGVLGAGLRNSGIAMAIAFIPGLVRLVRSRALEIREEVFVDASRAIGTPVRRIVGRHVFPNVLPPLVVQSAVLFGFAVLAEASLSFLGLGTTPPTASWGIMISDANDQVLAHPWAVLPSGLAIALTILAFNLVGDELQAALDPSPPVRKHGRLGLTAVSPDRLAPDDAAAESGTALLRVEKLTVDLTTPRGTAPVVQDVSFAIQPGEVLGLVGESGSGKTVTALAIMRLLASPPCRVVGGAIYFEERDLLSASLSEMSALRGGDLAMVFQDPMTSLNPSMTVGRQIAQVAMWHNGVSRREADRLTRDVLDMVGIPVQRADSYPHEFSGGMRQRVMIASALVCKPKLLIADEPTTALDVTIQAQILDLLRELRAEFNMAMLFVTHDLGVVAETCDRVAVMYAGQIVEACTTDELFSNPWHPYTEGLLRATPHRAEPRTPLYVIPGRVPAVGDWSHGCRLAPRCGYAKAACSETAVPLMEQDDRSVRCIRQSELDLTDGRIALR